MAKPTAIAPSPIAPPATATPWRARLELAPDHLRRQIVAGFEAKEAADATLAWVIGRWTWSFVDPELLDRAAEALLEVTT